MLRVILWVTLLFNSNALVGSLNEEGVALFTFKQSITQDPDGSLSNWNYSNESPCYWNGVTCKQQKVVSLSIPNKKLSGFLPSSLGSISGLRHVNLRDNRLYGSLPVELFKAQGLQGLVLYGNSFSGSLPFEIGDLRFLQYLDLSQNFFNGSFPRSILQCKRLRTLDLSQNNFSGSLPNGFGTVLVSLEKLDLSYNKFGGSVPNDLGKLSNLQGTVDLSHNLFSGSIPASLGDLPEKVYIDLTYNNLSGSIPQNGALMNRGPTAFIGNPGLCGPPLKNPCSSDTLGAVPPSLYPFLPSDYPPHGNGKNGQKHNGRGLSKSAVIAIVVCDVVGICLIGCLFSYCYARARPCSKSKEDEKGNRGECLCFRKDESDTFSQNIEQNELMPLDAQVTFDLDELLKASAFVLEKSGIGIVYKVVIDDGQTVTVRRLGEGGSQRFKEFQAEVEAIGKVKHPNIVTLRAYYWSVDEKLLIYEYVPNGNLAAALHAGKTETASFTPLSWSVRFKIIKGIARGLAYLHEFSPKKYIHGDLNPNNILLGHNMDPKIADFGLTRLASIAGGSPILQSNRITSENPQQRPETNATTEVSSISGSYSLSYYQAPESLKAMKPSQKWDVYSYGVILLEITTGRSPLIQMGNSEMEISQWIQHCIEEKKPVVDVLDPYLAEEPGKEHEIMAVINIAMACTNSSAEKRPAMRHVCDALDRLSESNE